MSHLDEPYGDPSAGGPILAGEPVLGDWVPGTIDLVFAAPKSVSVYYAALRSSKRYDDVERLLGAQEGAVGAALRYLNKHGAYAKVGGGWGEAPTYAESAGLRAIQLLHNAAHDEAEPPPHVHTHVFIEPYVTIESGSTEELDLRGFQREVDSVIANYDLVLRETLMRELPVRFEEREGYERREMMGVPDKALATFRGTRCLPFPEVRQITVAFPRSPSNTSL